VGRVDVNSAKYNAGLHFDHGGGPNKSPHSPPPSLSVRQVEGVLAIPGNVATFQQTENYMVSALGTVLKNDMMIKLRSNSLSIVDLEKVGPTLPLERKMRNVGNLTAIGKEARRRATLEVTCHAVSYKDTVS
jgi:hypothetical protein